MVKDHSIPSSALHHLVCTKDWSRVISHCQEHPQDARYRYCRTWFCESSMLFEAMQNDAPPEALLALIHADPSALERVEERSTGNVPLNFLIRSYDNLALLQEFLIRPATACYKRKGDITPFLYVWLHSQPSCLVPTIEAQPWTLKKHEHVKIFWKKLELMVEAIAISRQQAIRHRHPWPPLYEEVELITKFAEDCNSDWFVENPKFCTRKQVQLYRRGHIWSHLHSKIDYDDTTNQPTIAYKIHALVSMGNQECPFQVIEYMCAKYPQELETRDENGQLPLHSVLTTLPRHARRQRSEQKIIQLLLSRYPQAAQAQLFSYPDRDPEIPTSPQKVGGRYPLHVAVANRHTWKGGVCDIFHAAPEVLSVRDPWTGLYPFQLAAIPYGNKSYVDLETIFQLLRHCPDLLMDCRKVLRVQDSLTSATLTV